MTQDSKDLKFILAITYGGWEDVLQACRRASEVEQGVVKANDINQCYLWKKMLLTELDGEVSDPDLLICTSREQRLSNYLVNNLSYTELVFTKKLQPDFNEEDYVKALVEFQERNR
ncbi:(2Z,6Z)-farnesyl diphosphate synthase, chloroplastic [Selaginella moellendorffii]|nr:(2Z,6Z)-farnesyl diphosphate synthase, chloroplastic [Selaginella moellendorffii]|eukprot:XP_024520942.1 (2Z,6Z)-farnesyl diphosphate synthase, chloroplastic [Selaginella moellendorffii]